VVSHLRPTTPTANPYSAKWGGHVCSKRQWRCIDRGKLAWRPSEPSRTYLKAVVRFSHRLALGAAWMGQLMVLRAVQSRQLTWQGVVFRDAKGRRLSAPGNPQIKRRDAGIPPARSVTRRRKTAVELVELFERVAEKTGEGVPSSSRDCGSPSDPAPEKGTLRSAQPNEWGSGFLRNSCLNHLATEGLSLSRMCWDLYHWTRAFEAVRGG